MYLDNKIIDVGSSSDLRKIINRSLFLRDSFCFVLFFFLVSRMKYLQKINSSAGMTSTRTTTMMDERRGGLRVYDGGSERASEIADSPLGNWFPTRVAVSPSSSTPNFPVPRSPVLLRNYVFRYATTVSTPKTRPRRVAARAAEGIYLSRYAAVRFAANFILSFFLSFLGPLSLICCTALFA